MAPPDLIVPILVYGFECEYSALILVAKKWFRMRKDIQKDWWLNGILSFSLGHERWFGSDKQFWVFDKMFPTLFVVFVFFFLCHDRGWRAKINNNFEMRSWYDILVDFLARSSSI